MNFIVFHFSWIGIDLLRIGVAIKFSIVKSFQGNKEDEILIFDESFDVFVYEEESQKIILSMI